MAKFDVDYYWERLEAAIWFVDHDDQLLRLALNEFIDHAVLLNADMFCNPWRGELMLWAIAACPITSH